MVMANPYNQYRQQSVNTASPEKLVLMLYDGAIRFLRIAVEEIDTNNIEKSHKNITRVQDILQELMGNLDMGMEISKQLYAMYDYMNYRLVEANLLKDKKMVSEVIDLLSELRATWAEAIMIAKKQGNLLGGVVSEG